ncbi:MAG: magnesium transporter, partial [Ectothiorhodospiraceae bacterium]
LSAPVVDADGQLLGRIVASDVMDLVEDQAEHAMLARAGLDEDEDLFAPLLPSARKRAVWLGINLATAFLAAAVIGQFEATLEALVALAVLMPIVASMGGIAGSQTLSLAIRGLAQGQILPTNRSWLLGKEVGIGALNGVLWSFVVGGIAGAWYLNPGLGVVIGVALIINMVAAALAGLIVPLSLMRLGFDPAISGPVVLTTVTDVVGFLSFLGLASVFLL